MQKIVEQGFKIDLHIHSSASSGKDGDLVRNGTADNISLLIDHLVLNEVDVFSITDHDCFSLPIYQAAKKYELSGRIKKILPGVEFSVAMNGDDGVKLIHVIAVFDDTDERGVVHLAEVLPVKDIPYNDKENKRFTPDGFCAILDKIGLNAVLIAHQKNSETSQCAQPQDLSSLGMNALNDLINVEYFDSLEYKSEKQAIYHTLFKKKWNTEDYERVRYITGSDCHQWEVYPKHDANSQDGNMQFTYVKCLPTFKGLVMAVTDDSRIGKSRDFYSGIKKFQDKFDLQIASEDISIPLSAGVNVIIGDNSIGKSMLLHKLTNYSDLDGTNNIPKERKEDYEKYLNENKILVKTSLLSGDYSFDSQGEIRHHFENKTFANSFLKGKYPNDTPKDEYIGVVCDYMEGFYASLKTKFDYDDILSKIPSCTIYEEPADVKICSVSKCQQIFINSFKTTNLIRFITTLSNLVRQTGTLLALLIDEGDRKILSDYLASLRTMHKKYEDKQAKEQLACDVLNAINLGIESFDSLEDGLQSSAEKNYKDFQDGEEKIVSDIVRLIWLHSKIGKFTFNVQTPYQINYNHHDYLDISLVSRFARKITKIDTDYLVSLVSRVLTKNADFPDSSVIQEKELTDSIKDANLEGGKIGLELLKAKIEKQITDDFQTEKTISKNGADCTRDYSAGFNASEYFKILSIDDNGKIYIVDQPEDDVSQTGIAHEIIPDFRRMREKHQIILVTHNPQFVVNLDADNVIFLSKKDGRITIRSGALEYVDNESDILQIIEDNLEGGEESIKKRWKRYDKSNQN